MNLGEKFKNFQLGKIKLGPRWFSLEGISNNTHL